MKSETAREFEALLQREQETLLSGQLSELDAIIEQKQDLLARVADGTDAADDVDIGKLQKFAARNQILIEASLRGVRSAQDRLSEIHRASSNLETYTRRGQRADLCPTSPSHESRA